MAKNRQKTAQMVKNAQICRKCSFCGVGGFGNFSEQFFLLKTNNFPVIFSLKKTIEIWGRGGRDGRTAKIFRGGEEVKKLGRGGLNFG